MLCIYNMTTSSSYLAFNSYEITFLHEFYNLDYITASTITLLKPFLFVALVLVWMLFISDKIKSNGKV